MQVVLGPANSSNALKAKLGWTLNGPTGKLYHQTRVDQDLFMFKSETNLFRIRQAQLYLVKRSFEKIFIDCPEKECKTDKDETKAKTILENTCPQKERLKAVVDKISRNIFYYKKVVVWNGGNHGCINFKFCPLCFDIGLWVGGWCCEAVMFRPFGRLGLCVMVIMALKFNCMKFLF